MRVVGHGKSFDRQQLCADAQREARVRAADVRKQHDSFGLGGWLRGHLAGCQSGRI
jgi:hypothetical protein